MGKELVEKSTVLDGDEIPAGCLRITREAY